VSWAKIRGSCRSNKDRNLGYRGFGGTPGLASTPKINKRQLSKRLSSERNAGTLV